MGRVEAIRLALAELGDVSGEEVAAFVRERYGLKVMPGIVVVVKAMLREKEMLASSRQPQGAERASANLPVQGQRPL